MSIKLIPIAMKCRWQGTIARHCFCCREGKSPPQGCAGCVQVVPHIIDSKTFATLRRLENSGEP